MAKRVKPSACQKLDQNNFGNGNDLGPFSELIRNKVKEQRAAAKVDKLAQHKKVWFENRQLISPTCADLLKVFPIEMWIRLLDCLDVDDKVNCALAFPLFSKLLGTHWLFLKVFPSVAGYLKHEDIENCMRACPEWRMGILSLTEEHLANADQIENCLAPFEEQIQFPKISLSETFLCRYKYFITVIIPLRRDVLKSNPHFELYQGNSITMKVYYHPQLFSEFAKFLNIKGSNIYHLTLIGVNVNMSVAMIYMLVHQVLLKCNKLKSLTLDVWKCVSWDMEDSEIFQSVMTKPTFPNHACLESLHLNLGHSKALIIADLLFIKYSKQLKSAHVTFGVRPYYQLYAKFELSNLTEFVAKNGNAALLLELLDKMTLPNLQKLALQIDMRAPQLEKLICVLSIHPKLSFVDLRFTHSFRGWDKDDILAVSPNICGSNKVQKLKSIYHCHYFSFDFFLCFPHLRELEFVYETKENSVISKQDTVLDNDVDDAEFGITENAVPLNSELHEALSVNDITEDIERNFKCVTLAKPVSTEPIKSSPEDLIYFQVTSNGTLQNVYVSKIWSVLQYLEIIRFPKTGMLYSRRRLEWLKLGYIGQLRSRIEVINSEVKRRREEKKLEIYSKHKLQSTQVTLCSMGNNLEQMFQKVFPLVYTYISKSDVLLCRRICHSWCQAVDSCLEMVPCFGKVLSSNSIVTPQHFDFWYLLYISKNPKNLPDDLLHHIRNPLVGRSLQINITEFDEGTINKITISSFSSIKSITKYVHNLKVSFENQVEISTTEYYQLCDLILQTIYNLKSFVMDKVNVAWKIHDRGMVTFKSVLNSNLPHLETLQLMSCANVHHIHLKLVEIFGSQLKRLYVDWYGDNYRSEVPVFFGNEILEELALPYTWRIDCPKMINLKRLCIHLDSHVQDFKYWSIFENILQTPLNVLELKVSKGFSGFQSHQLLCTQAIKASYCKCLVLTIENIDNFLFDILVLFRYLQRLVICYGRWINHWKFSLTLSNSGKLSDKKGVQHSHIDLKKYLSNDIKKARVDQSNVWKVLPKLEIIKIVEGTSIQDKEISKTFIRT